MKVFGLIFIIGVLFIPGATRVAADTLGGYFVTDGNGFEVTVNNTPSFGSIASLDLGSDGIDEVIVGARAGEDPEVVLLRADGSVINRWLAYEKEFRGGVQVVAADFDGDGRDEIMTAPGRGGSPRIRIFDGFGREKFAGSFFAFDKTTKQGVELAAVRVKGQTSPLIVAGVWDGASVVFKIFNREGVPTGSVFTFTNFKQGTTFRIMPLDLGGDGKDEIALVGETDEGAALYLARTDGSIINHWTLAEGSHVTSGIPPKNAKLVIDAETTQSVIANIDALTYDAARKKFHWITEDGMLVAQDTFGRVERVRQLEFSIAPSIVTLTYGAFIPVKRGNEVSSPSQMEVKEGSLLILHSRPHLASRNVSKYIEISLDDQRLRFYAAGVLQGDFVVSTGKPFSPTPKGEFKIENKIPNAWSRTAGLWMPYWMAFVPSGKYGLHRLPYWPDGRIEGETSLGRKVSGGCVRLGIEEAKKLYEWADIGTPVYIN